MDRPEELKNLYAIITYCWNVLKQTDYRNMTDEKWEEIIEDAKKKTESLHKIDVPLGKLLQTMNYCIYDYLCPSVRKKYEEDYRNGKE